LKEISASTDDDNSQTTFKRNDDSLKVGEIKGSDVTVYWGDPTVPIKNNEDEELRASLNASRRSSLSSRGSKRDVTEGKSIDEEEEEVLRYHKAILSNIDFNIAPSELCAVVGRVGSGKTTLVSAMLNETFIGNGHVSMNGSVAYAAQSPWILNATLRDNITFGKAYEEEKYNKIIKACQLTHDLALLDHGDLTEIGENGINLSGGQKARVSIARAAYSGADIIILDDPLSALDPEVGQKLFDACIVKLMKGKTRVLVTNQLQCLKYCDSIIALSDGHIVEQGSFQELSRGSGEVRRILDELRASKTSSTDRESEGRARSESDASTGRKRGESVSEEKNKTEKKENIGLVSEEERNVGAVSLSVYKKYLSSGGGLCLFALCYFIYILCSANQLLSSAWITLWTQDASYEKHSRAFYLGLYALWAITLGIFTFFRSFMLANFGVRASDDLHNNLLKSILAAPMSFFDATPTGRILSRFSKDLYSIDLELTEYLDFFLSMGVTVVVSLGTIIFVTPWFGIAVIPLAFIYIKVLNYFRDVARETKRIESVSRSPVFAHFSETLGGLGTIRAYGEADRFIDEFETKIDTNIRAYYNNKNADRWLSTRLELLGSVIAGLSAVFATNVAISSAETAFSSDTNFASYAGLSMSFSISITGLLNWLVRSFAQMEAAMNAAERVLYYTENIAQEAPARIEDMSDFSRTTSNESDDRRSPSVEKALEAKGVEKIASDWPESGKIELNNLKMRYRPENPLVIRGLNVTIEGGERIGVVGRTGSGKSSLLLTLLRIVEPTLLDEGYEAPIVVDGVDILRIGLHDLRERIQIIPQNPVLFSGTIRSNMDPFDDYTNEEIWSALQRCGMKKTIEAFEDLLDAPVAEYGENLSQGQRQLLCLGRALLKKCRILLLDEATSSVDFETDKEIQRTLREDFKDCTVLTIAHRINTIRDSDKILVMKDGQAAEFAPPDDLLQDETSMFYDIVKHSETEH
jgi:ABC-type multidrug transport system fused ATPase/permease subunit